MNTLNTIHYILYGKEIDPDSKMSFRDKCLYHLSMASIFIALILLIYLFYLSLWPFKVTELKKFYTAKNEYKRGEPLAVIIDYCKEKEMVGHVIPEIVDGRRYFLYDFSLNLPVGCNVYEYSSISVPSDVQPGVYKIRITVEYKINKLRETRKVYESNSFTIK